MSKRVQFRRGPIANFASFLPAEGEVTYVSDRSTLRVGDGSTTSGIELLRAGYLSKSVAGSSNVTLTQAEAARPVLELTGVLTGNIQVIFPITLNSGKPYIVKNSTTGSYTVTLIGATGTGVVAPTGSIMQVFHDGTNMVSFGSSSYFADGTAALPSISFISDPNTGFYSAGADTIGISTGGAVRATVSSAGVLNLTATTEATTGGAGSFTTSGGIYAAKAIASGSTTDSTTTTTGGLLIAGGAGISKTLSTTGRILTTSVKTTTYTITTSDHTIVCNSSSAFTLSLPSISSASTGRQYIIKNKNTGQITLTASGSETIDGSVSVYLNQYESLTIVSDGTVWNVI